MSESEPQYQADLEFANGMVAWSLNVMIDGVTQTRIKHGVARNEREASSQATQAARRHRAELRAERKTINVRLAP